MKPFKKQVRLGTTRIEGHVYADIIFTADGRLSISGVIGPKANGDAPGSCGQYIVGFREYDKRGHMSLSDITPAHGWDADIIRRFFDAWDAWHLNDMKAACEHMTGPEWDASRELTLYYFRLTGAASALKNSTEKAALAALRRGEVFSPSPEQVQAATLPYEVIHHDPNLPARGQFYEPKRPLYAGDKGASETKTAGRLQPNEHPSGLLCKPCPTCGYKYGTAWRKVEVPADVLEFLRGLPDADIPPPPCWSISRK